MNLTNAVKTLVEAVQNPTLGLPDEVFYYISRTTPLVNVDLLINDGEGRNLLSWRDDCHCGRGWHLPGGIVRLKETLLERVAKVAINEVGTTLEVDSIPLAVNEMINHQQTYRGHFISVLFRCRLNYPYVLPRNANPKEPGYLQWHVGCPDDLITYHKVYQHLLESHLDKVDKNTKLLTGFCR